MLRCNAHFHFPRTADWSATRKDARWSVLQALNKPKSVTRNEHTFVEREGMGGGGSAALLWRLFALRGCCGTPRFALPFVQQERRVCVKKENTLKTNSLQSHDLKYVGTLSFINNCHEL